MNGPVCRPVPTSGKRPMCLIEKTANVFFDRLLFPDHVITCLLGSELVLQ